LGSGEEVLAAGVRGLYDLATEYGTWAAFWLLEIDVAILVWEEELRSHAHGRPGGVAEFFKGKGAQVDPTAEEAGRGCRIPGPEEDFRFIGGAGVAAEREAAATLGIPEPIARNGSGVRVAVATVGGGALGNRWREQGVDDIAGEGFGVRGYHTQEAKEEALDAQDAQTDGKVVRPAGCPGGTRQAAGGSLPPPPHAHPQDQDQDREAGSQDRV